MKYGILTGGLVGRGSVMKTMGLAVLCLVAGLSSCSKRKPLIASTNASELPAITIAKGGNYLLTYYDHGKGTFATGRKIAEVPASARSWVRVVDLNLKPGARRDHELVYVADLEHPDGKGAYRYVVVSRRAFELAAANRARSSTTTSGSGGVTIYVTAWCSACRQAKAWMRKEGIAFVERDIEKDPTAAAELMKKARAAGISPSGVPVIDVKGTLIAGFNAARVAELLGRKKRP